MFVVSTKNGICWLVHWSPSTYSSPPLNRFTAQPQLKGSLHNHSLEVDDGVDSGYYKRYLPVGSLVTVYLQFSTTEQVHCTTTA
ncbi:hypothetical protein J6590_062855 [Homalodisca vitripennis]|nr:hypothetical protein J6590_062855 [Homalodisca vitripennis]